MIHVIFVLALLAEHPLLSIVAIGLALLFVATVINNR